MCFTSVYLRYATMSKEICSKISSKNFARIFLRKASSQNFPESLVMIFCIVWRIHNVSGGSSVMKFFPFIYTLKSLTQPLINNLLTLNEVMSNISRVLLHYLKPPSLYSMLGDVCLSHVFWFWQSCTGQHVFRSRHGILSTTKVLQKIIKTFKINIYTG